MLHYSIVQRGQSHEEQAGAQLGRSFSSRAVLDAVLHHRCCGFCRCFGGYTYIYIYIHIHIYIYRHTQVHMYIYIYRERERGRCIIMLYYHRYSIGYRGIIYYVILHAKQWKHRLTARLTGRRPNIRA